MRRVLLSLALLASTGCNLVIDPDGVEPPVPNKAVSSLAVSPAANDVPRGATAQLTATATYDDGTTGNVTATATWSTSQASIATVSGGAVTAAASAGTAIISASLGGRFGNALVTAVAPAVASIAVTPASQGLVQGLTRQLQANATYTDGTVLDVTSTATWTTSSAAIATVSPDGLVTASAPGGTTGAATITAAIGGRNGTATITVTAPVVTSVAVAPDTATLQPGATQQFQAIATYDNATTQNVTALVSTTWSSSATGVATVNNAGSKGLVTAVAAGGPATISAVYSGITGTAQVSVTSATVTSIVIDRPIGTGAIPKGARAQLRATAHFNDTTTADVTGQATWVSDAPAIASVSDVVATRGEVTAVAAAGTANVTATFGGQTGSYPVAAAPAAIDSIAVSAASLSVAKGLTEQLTATATFTDGTTADVTSLVTWTSGATSVATVSATGLVTALAQGTSLLTAAASGRSGSVTITVLPPALTGVALAPSPATLTVGGTVQMTLTASLTDGSSEDVASTATWSSDAAAVANVSATGLVSAVSAGSAVVTAAYGGFTRTSTVTVTGATVTSITVDRPVGTGPLPKGVSAQLRAMATYSDATQQDVTDQATWTSGAPTVVSASDTAPTKGLVTAVAATGSATITAAFGGRSGTFSVTAAAAAVQSIAVTATSYSVPKGLTRQFTATATYTDATTGNVSSTATWSSSASTVATVSAAGLATGQAEGSAFIRASVGSVTGEATLTVLPPQLTGVAIAPTSVTMAAAETLQVILTASFSDGSSQDVAAAATWSTNNAAAATVSATGLVTAVAAGSATVTGLYGGYTRTVTVTVSTATVVSVAIDRPVGTGAIPKGSTAQLRATATYDDATTQDVTGQANWSSNATAVATVSNAAGSKGLVTAAAAAGTATLTATFAGRSATFDVTAAPAVVQSVAVTASSLSVAKGLTQQFTATATYTDATTANVSATAAWGSSNLAVATISATGLVTTLTQGSSDISATFDGKTGSATLAVTPPTIVSIAVTRPVGTGAIPKGATAQLEATATYTDATTGSVTSTATWSSSALSIATVSDATGTKGLVTAVAATGGATITAAVGPTSGTFGVTVTAAVIQSIAITPPSPTLAVGEMVPLTATATFTDGTLSNVTTSITWGGGSPFAAVSNAIGTKGQLTGVTAGGPVAVTATDTATGTIGTTSVTVTPPVVQSVVVEPVPPDTAVTSVGGTIQLRATAHYSDLSTRDVTEDTTTSWTSSAGATVSSTPGTKGLVTGTAGGTATITANVDGTLGQLSVTVRTIQSIAVSGYTAPVPAGLTVQLTAIATLTGGGTQDVTADAAWAPTTGTIATVSNVAPTKGLVTAIASSGFVDFTATLNGVTSPAHRVTVTSPQLVSVAVTDLAGNPGPYAPIPNGLTMQLKATGTYTNGSTQDLTSTATWTSNLPTVVGTTAINGQVQALASTGDANITATVTTGYGTFAGTQLVSATAPVLQSIAITLEPPGQPIPPIPDGTTLQLRATGTYSDLSTQNLTSSVTWLSHSPLVIDFTAIPGEVKAFVSTGTAAIDATLGTVTGTVTLQATDPRLDSIAITLPFPNELDPVPAIPDGTYVDLVATGYFSNGTTQDLTAAATWAPPQGGPTAVGVAPGGRVFAQSSAGSELVTATVIHPISGTVTGQRSVSVTAPLLARIELYDFSGSRIDGLTIALPDGLTLDFWVNEVYSNGTTVSWSTQASGYNMDPTVAELIGFGDYFQARAIGTPGQVAALGAYIDDPIAGFKSAEIGIRVDPPLPTFLSMTPDPFPGSLVVASGAHQQMSAWLNFTDGSQQDLTQEVEWHPTEAEALALGLPIQVGNYATNRGMVTTRALGSASVWFIHPVYGTSSSISVDVTSAAVTAIEIAFERDEWNPYQSPDLPFSPTPNAFTAKATAAWSDGQRTDVTQFVTWSTSDFNVITVSNDAPNRGKVTTVTSPGAAVLSATWMGVTGDLPITVHAPMIIWIVPFPGVMNVPTNSTFTALTATAIYDDWTFGDVTELVNWSSAPVAVATVSNAPGTRGDITTYSNVGTAIITATDPVSGSQSSSGIVVEDKGPGMFRILPGSPTVSIVRDTRLAAVMEYADGSAYDLSNASYWESSDPATIYVDWEGACWGKRPGSANITAWYPPPPAVAYSATVTASVGLGDAQVQLSSAPYIPLGQTWQLRAWATSYDDPTMAPVDVTNLLVWTSWYPARANFVGPGVIQATPDPMNAGWFEYEVYEPSNPGRTWRSSGNVVADSYVPGTSYIVPGGAFVIPVGATGRLALWAWLATSGSVDVTDYSLWWTGNPALLEVVPGRPGTVRALAVGSTFVTGDFNGSAVSSPVTVTSSPVVSLSISPAVQTVSAGTEWSGPTVEYQAWANFQDGSSGDVTPFVQWSTTDSTVAYSVGTPPNAFRGLKAGASTTIVASLGRATGTAQLQVTDPAPNWAQIEGPGTVYLGIQAQFHVSGWFDGGATQLLTEQAYWWSENPGCIDVSDSPGLKGRAWANMPGCGTYLHAQFPGGVQYFRWVTSQDSGPLTWMQPIVPNPVSLSVGGRTQVQVFGDLSASCVGCVDLTQVATWTVSDPSVASVAVSADGGGPVTMTVTAKLPGSTQLCANYAPWMQCGWIDVSWPLVSSLSIEYFDPDDGNDGQPAQPCQGTAMVPSPFPAGSALELKACLTADNGQRYDVTSLGTWQSTDPSAAWVSDGAATKGYVYINPYAPVAVAPVQVWFPAWGVFNYSVPINPGAALDVLRTENNVTVQRPGATSDGMGGLRVVGYFTDGSTRSLTRYASYTFADATAATLGDFGEWGQLEVVGLQPTATTLTVALPDPLLYAGSRSTAVMVNADARPYVELSVGLDTPRIPMSVPVKAWAMAIDPIGMVWDVSDVYRWIPWGVAPSYAPAWTSSNPAVAVVTPDGLVVGQSPGFATIEATLDGQIGQFEVEVTSAVFTGLVVTPENQAVPAYGVATEPLRALATYSDGSQYDVTEYASWGWDPYLNWTGPGEFTTGTTSAQAQVWVDWAGFSDWSYVLIF